MLESEIDSKNDTESDVDNEPVLAMNSSILIFLKPNHILFDYFEKSNAYNPVVKLYADKIIQSLWMIAVKKDQLNEAYKEWNTIRDEFTFGYHCLTNPDVDHFTEKIIMSWVKRRR